MCFWNKYLLFLIDSVNKTSTSINEEYKSKFSLEEKKRIDGKSILKSIQAEKSNKLVFAHLNINSTWNLFELLSKQMKGNIDLLITSGKKIDDSFPIENFLTNGFSSPHRLDLD